MNILAGATFLGGVVMLVASIVIYLRAEDTSFKKLVDEIQASRGDQKNFVLNEAFIKDHERLESVSEHASRINSYANSLFNSIESLKKEQELFSHRMHAMDKKIAGVKREITVNVKQAVPVEILDTKKRKVEKPLDQKVEPSYPIKPSRPKTGKMNLKARAFTSGAESLLGRAGL